MKTIKNPENGAPIQSYNYRGTVLFEEPLLPGQTAELEDDQAEYLLSVYGFLEEAVVEEVVEEVVKKPKKRTRKVKK